MRQRKQLGAWPVMLVAVVKIEVSTSMLGRCVVVLSVFVVIGCDTSPSLFFVDHDEAGSKNVIVHSDLNASSATSRKPRALWSSVSTECHVTRRVHVRLQVRGKILQLACARCMSVRCRVTIGSHPDASGARNDTYGAQWCDRVEAYLPK